MFNQEIRVVEARIYLKQLKERQTMCVLVSSEVFKGVRYFDGYQVDRNGNWIEWDMTEKDLNRMVKEGRMQRVQ